MPTPDEIIDVIGTEKYNKLLDGCSIVRQRKRMVFWQERLLEQLAEHFGDQIPKNPEEYLAFFSGIDRAETTGLTLEEIQKSTGFVLPEDYRQLVEQQNSSLQFYFNDHEAEAPESEGRLWRIKAPRDLAEQIRVGGSGTEPFYRCLGLFARMHLEFTGGDSVEASNGTISKERVFAGFVIGEDNGDYLYLDCADEFSVWIFYHDGCDVKKVARSFGEWVARARQA